MSEWNIAATASTPSLPSFPFLPVAPEILNAQRTEITLSVETQSVGGDAGGSYIGDRGWCYETLLPLT